MLHGHSMASPCFTIQDHQSSCLGISTHFHAWNTGFHPCMSTCTPFQSQASRPQKISKKQFVCVKTLFENQALQNLMAVYHPFFPDSMAIVESPLNNWGTGWYRYNSVADWAEAPSLGSHLAHFDTPKCSLQLTEASLLLMMLLRFCGNRASTPRKCERYWRLQSWSLAVQNPCWLMMSWGIILPCMHWGL